MRWREARVWSRLTFIEGTRRCSQLSRKWTASPDSTRAPVLGKSTSSDSCPGVWPGVDRIITLPSPNTSWSPASFSIFCVAAKAELDGLGHGPVVLGALDEDGGGRNRPMFPT